MTESEFATFEAVSAIVVVLDAHSRIVYWNQACSDFSGYSLEEARGRQLSSFLLGPGGGDLTSPWVTKNGERRRIGWSDKLAKGADGQVQYVIKTGIDRTERMQAEDKLAGLIGLAADAIISIDSNHRIVMYDQRAETIFGWSAVEVMGKPVEILLPKGLRGAPGQDLRALVDGDVPPRRTGHQMPVLIGLRKSGEEFSAQGAISQREIEGTNLLTVGLRDITKEQRRERDRHVLAELGAALAATIDYEETLACIGNLMVQELADLFMVDVIDGAGNPRPTRVFHRSPSQKALCESFERLPIDGRRAAGVPSMVGSKQPRLLTEVTPQDLESLARDDEHLRALRELAPRSLIVVPLLARGNLLGSLVFASLHPSRRYGQHDLRLAEDVAQRAALAIENAHLYERAWRARDDLREANEQMVRATMRAQELADAAEAARVRAEEGERELRKVSEFRELFIGVVGHDLRNPLGAIGLFAASLLQRGRLDERDEKTVRRIIASGERMTRMILQLLDLTRARLGGGFPLEPKPTDLRQVCSSVVDEFDAAIRLEVDGDVTGTWDPDRLAEALSNIAGNAIEHAAPGTAVVVKAHAEDSEVVIEIINQGDPIPGDVLPFIFEPFRRAAQRQRSPTGNLGLGLYIARQIVHSGHGTLVAYSVDGTTTFLMRLPRHPPGAAQIQSASAQGMP